MGRPEVCPPEEPQAWGQGPEQLFLVLTTLGAGISPSFPLLGTISTATFKSRRVAGVCGEHASFPGVFTASPMYSYCSFLQMRELRRREDPPIVTVLRCTRLG